MSRTRLTESPHPPGTKAPWRRLSPLAAGFLLCLLCGCKWLELKMPGEPLPKRDAALRGQTREFAGEFAATIQQAADEIARTTDDRRQQDAAIRWKIGAIRSVRQAALRSSPTLALVDTWALCRQMSEFFERGAGREIFGPSQALALTNSRAMETRIATIATNTLDRGDLGTAEEFLAKYVTAYPLRNLMFDRAPVSGQWEELHGESPPTPAGTTSEALADLSDRVQILSEHVPAELRWRLSLETGGLEDALAESRQTLRDIDAAMKSIAATAAATPATLSNAVHELRALGPAFTGLEKQWSLTLGAIDTQRIALARDIAAEREAVLKAVDQQRAALMKELMREVDTQRVALMKEVQLVTGELADRSIQHVRGVIRDMLFYGVLFLVVLLGLPFLFGYLVGRTTQFRPAAKTEAPKA